MLIDKVAVEMESDQLLCTALKPKSFANNGIKGWMQYSSEKVEKPPRNNALFVRVNAGVPCLMRSLLVCIVEARSAVMAFNFCPSMKHDVAHVRFAL